VGAVTFPLIPRRRVLGLPFGGLHSIRRGPGSDVAGSRPYEPGDDVGRIDWNASARLSLARGSDEFVVREHYAEEAPRAVVLCDRRPSMSLFPETWPWLRKPEALRLAVRLIADSVAAARGLLGYLDQADGDLSWRPPRSEAELGEVDPSRPFGAPDETLATCLRHVSDQRGDLPAGSFVFVLSDFLVRPSRDEWLRTFERGLELVPVVLQDPVWEQSFPYVGELVVPFHDVESNRLRTVRLSVGEANALRRANEERLRELLREFRALGFDPVVVSSHEWHDIVFAFLTWADQRLLSRGRR
jgi:uncharacterized protein (DUF58 family)